jgi:hypothetical protein
MSVCQDQLLTFFFQWPDVLPDLSVLSLNCPCMFGPWFRTSMGYEVLCCYVPPRVKRFWIITSLDYIMSLNMASLNNIFLDLLQICHRYQWHRRQIFAPFSLALLIPAANCHRYERHRCRWHRWQILATISGCRHLKVNLKAKTYVYDYSTTQRCPKKIIKIFLLEGFFHLPPVSLRPVANLELRISPRIFEKIRNDPNGIIRGLGETDSRKKPEAKNLVTLSL